jgi:hypothetical protein
LHQCRCSCIYFAGSLTATDARIVNLETGITRSEAYERKGINYRITRENAETAGAGIDLTQGRAPPVLDVPDSGRMLSFSFACVTSATGWAATGNHPGLNLLSDLSGSTGAELALQVAQTSQPEDLIQGRTVVRARTD